MVRPVAWAPPQMVEEAYAVREPRPVMFCEPPVTAPPSVNAGSVVVQLGTDEPLVTKMDEAASEVAETAPVALVYKVPDGALEIVRFVVLAEPKYPVPETVSAVLLAYGNVLACDVDVAMKYAAVGVEVAATVPLELTHSKELERFASERLPAVSKEEVAVAPKYAGPYAEKSVVEAPPENCWREVHVLALESN